MNRFTVTILALVYAAYVLIATLHPFSFSWSELPSFREGLAVFFARPGRRDVIVNILLFIPFGFLLYCLSVFTSRARSAIFVSVFVGGVFSLIVELLQILTLRHPSVADVIANALGSGGGAVLAALWPPGAAELVGRVWTRVEASGLVLGTALLYAAVPLMLSVFQFITPFGIWNSQFSFQIGNEATFDRPWLGKIYLVAVYERALSAHEVSERFRQGIARSVSYNPRRDAPVALYTFTEREGRLVHDKSGFESPLDLEIVPKSHVRWLDSSGIELVRPAVLKSREPGTKLVKSLSASQELSIEAWVAPHDIVQGGPARIVSLSQDAGARNFTLGQEGAEVHFRLRTPVSGLNGSPLSLRTAGGLWNTDMFHIVAAYREGVQRLFINGVEQAEALDLTRDGIIGLGARKTAIARLAYSFFYFAPVSILIAVFFSRRFTHFIFSGVSAIAITTALVGGTELFQAFAFHRAIDVTLVVFGLIIAVLGTLAGLGLVQPCTSNIEPLQSLA